MQLVEQQSVFALHDVPAIAHPSAEVGVQLPVESHIFEQHTSFDAHGVPNTPHGLLASGGLPPPCLPPHATTTRKKRPSQGLWIMGVPLSVGSGGPDDAKGRNDLQVMMSVPKTEAPTSDQVVRHCVHASSVPMTPKSRKLPAEHGE